MILPHAKNILIINPGALGDYIAATTAIVEVRKAYPMAHIAILVTEYFRNVAPEGTIVDEIINYDTYKSAKGLLILINQLRKRKFDIAINLRWSSERDLIIAAFSGSKISIGLKKGILSALYSKSALCSMNEEHEFVKKLAIVKLLDIPVSQPHPFIYSNLEAESYIDAYFSDCNLEKKNVVVMSPYASNSLKSWSEDKFIELAKLIIENLELNVIVSFGPADKPKAEAFVNAVGKGCLLAPNTNIAQLVALIKAGKICVCNNSGVMNIAMAVKTPCVAMSSTLKQLWGTIGEYDITIEPEGLKEYYRTQNFRKIDDVVVKNMLDSTSVEIVFSAVSSTIIKLGA